MPWRDWVAMPTRVAALHDNLIPLIRKELHTMADQITQTLNDVAEQVRGPLATSIGELIAERDQLAARNAELEGTEVAQSAATENVRSAFADVAGVFTRNPETPDVPADLPVPEPSGEQEVTPGDSEATDPADVAESTDGGTDTATS
jgi:hypothetical protein